MQRIVHVIITIFECGELCKQDRSALTFTDNVRLQNALTVKQYWLACMSGNFCQQHVVRVQSNIYDMIIISQVWMESLWSYFKGANS